MAVVSPAEAFGYATSREMLLLYAVVVAGYVALIVGGIFGVEWAVRGGGAGVVGQLLAALFTLAGFVSLLGGLVALVYKVIADANGAAQS